MTRAKTGQKKKRGQRMAEERSYRWPFYPLAFSPQMTQKTNGQRLYDEVIEHNSINCSVPRNSTNKFTVEQIAKNSMIEIPIEHLSERLNEISMPRGQSFYGRVRPKLDDIAKSSNLRWWISSNGLNMDELTEPMLVLDPFDEDAGELMCRSQREPNGRWPKSHYDEIASRLDAKGYMPLDVLTGRSRQKLAAWNQKNPRRPVHTFAAAMQSNSACKMRTAVLKRLYRARERWEKSGHKLSR
jgi:hypothetical protein